MQLLTVLSKVATEFFLKRILYLKKNRNLGGFSNMKKALFAVALSSLLAFGAAAEGYVSANDLDQGTIDSATSLEDGFKILASAEKIVIIDKAGDNKSNADGEKFNQRINLKGAGNLSARCVSFPVKAGETIVVDCETSSKTDTRTIVVVDSEGNQLFSVAAAPGAVARGKGKAAKAGTYYAYSSKGGMYIYQIDVKK